ncbi:hypothetical protein CR194_06865 [Salipaludibacillus keqinensis]|uniref:LITAF domain-containing protein n=1 Tax=Salipaludibacillus keqinensis TaxID=2045207 RepID=A0A323TK98_9BACI|nr:hypothetical protein [Salipaludibacillus keqinensis]PYZ95229.1 hypothetical protein CR194_06865 [Salipaludibacillus keqinensis]
MSHTVESEKQASLRCRACESGQVMIISKYRYFIMTSIFPVIVTVAIAFLFDLLFLLFIPALLLMNLMIAERKTPLLICQNCRKRSRGHLTKTANPHN